MERSNARAVICGFLVPWLGLSLLALAPGVSGCGQTPGTTDNVESTSEALTIPGTSVLGFETTGGWTVSSGAVALSTGAHTQGSAALAVTAPQNYTTLVSAALSSGLAPLASLTDSGAALQLDLSLPASQPNPNYYGAVQLYINVPSKGVNNQFLGQTELTGQQLGTFQTYRFPVTDFVRSKLAGQTYSDLKFTVALNAPAGARGTYVFDNLRCTSPAARPVGSIPSVDLTASLSTSPPANTPGTATFAGGTIQIPASFHVRVGSAGTGTAKLELGFGSTTSVSCTYNASPDKTAYNFASCNTQSKSGDIVAAAFAKLTIVSADPGAALTKIKAQLAHNLLGDQVGTKLAVPTPTYWGETRAEVASITQAWGNAQAAALPSTRTTLTLPVPDFALQHGDGLPVNVLNGGPPAPLDPPFDFKGSLQNGPGRDPSGMFDAYYRLYGNVQPAAQGTNFTSHFEANAVVGVRVLYTDIDVLTASVTVDTDNGGTDGQGSVDPHTNAHATANLFGAQPPFFDESGDIQSGIKRDLSTSATVDAPPIPIWIFSVEGGVIASVGFSVDAAMAINGFQVIATPHAEVDAHIFGGVDVGVASGGVNVTVQLIGVDVPITGSALLTVDPSPAVCAASFNADIDGEVDITSGGGEVDLEGTLGVCPVCLDGSLPILSWPPRNLGKAPFPDPFPIHLVSLPLPALDPSTCRLSLEVKIPRPTAAYVGVPAASVASATRPAERGKAEVPLDCSVVTLTWSADMPGVQFSPSNVGCSPTITFPAAGPVNLTVMAVDQFGETGTATKALTVQPAPTTALPQISTPFQDGVYASGEILFSGFVSGGNGQATAEWTLDGNTIFSQDYQSGQNVPLLSFTHQANDNFIHTVVLTVTDSSKVPRQDTVTFETFFVH